MDTYEIKQSILEHGKQADCTSAFQNKYTVNGSSPLYEAIVETGWYLEPKLAGIGPARPYWQYILADQAVYISRSYLVRQEGSAYLDCH